MKSSSFSSQKSANRWLIVDFDGTCTERDTTPILPKIASVLSQDDEDGLSKRLSTFEALEKEYLHLYGAASTIISKQSSSKISLDEALDALDRVSTDVTAKVSKSRVLQGLHVSPSEISNLIQTNSEVGDHVKLRSGCAATLATANQRWGFQLGVLSINWCPSLINAALLQPIRRHHRSTTIQQSEEDGEEEEELAVPIWSNSVDSDGVVELAVPGALAKKARISHLKGASPSSLPSLVIYVGDSKTDLAALVESDVGILIGECCSTVKLAERWGVSVIPLSKRLDHKPKQGKTEVLWLANSWLEIEELLRDLA